jgi:diaminohydroxyphosphoribosylaminopyrimidine deaminase / 5-amino-6-(5-phosphoribosylamino)uracil reductase
MRRVPDDDYFMRLALREAHQGVGRTHPNPAVGAVIVKAGRVLATGYHARAGTGHAEANALMLAGKRARGATIYSTLEPCDHFGRTPPCTQAILEAGLARVVYGSSDPNPLVNGKGVKRMRRAGLVVDGGVLEAECNALNEAFFKVMRTGVPFVTVKSAMTLDGKAATRTGASKWITSESSRERVHQLRNRVDAIVVGAGTVVADDPRLTTRLPSGRDPMRVVIDPSLRTRPSAKVFASGGAPVVVVTAKTADSDRARAFLKRGVRVLTVGERRGELKLDQALRVLAKEGILHLLVEGGATTISAFLRAKLVDELMLFIAPTLFGHEGLTWSGVLPVATPAQGIKTTIASVECVDSDVLIRARVVKA